MSRTATPLEQPASNGNTAKSNGTTEAAASLEPVYRFYLSPPPTSGTPGIATPGLAAPGVYGNSAGAKGSQPEHAQMYPSMGMMPFNPYMMSPPAQAMASVSAFGHPAYYAPTQQPLYYPSAFGMAAIPPTVQARSSNMSQTTSSTQPKDEEKTPIVNEAGIPMGGFGKDQDGQYIEIKFPTFGQAQVQQMLQQVQMQQQQQQLAQALAATTLQPAPQQQPPPASSSPPPNTDEKPANLGDMLGTQNISIYDAENFADAHMEDIVADRKAFFWKIPNWDKLERRATSDVFKCGGFIWRILLRPFGSSHKGVLSLFLECLGTSDSSEDWRCICRFVLAISNPHDPTHNTHGSAYHCFHRSNPNWGFTRFMKLADLRTAPAPGVRPYIEDGACTIGAYLHVIKDPSQ
ncbi:ubiquitin-specific protease ubp15 [Coemansia sp. RSA 989]|nr:TRAF-like protein [Coemansia mojavensis]KAJ1861985.1 ubiquitin-specific protease ubp15 [Coemansia sp. RSA 989]KAJ1870958.1 ubiquitin-specific protease ubp15 [Coemansia sp. RSA 990]KAJ2632501.1 ubiquitin-specific protease ubp15 [Coemansia sp. RSA 1290]KAJ2646407.1 ubiquitin-specific protease ubp15 [Coemansia sp. RSA 1250]KAJ2668161.1 ubiquitin-specific protease ubp15 [Coemansia sp. RSA 1085]